MFRVCTLLLVLWSAILPLLSPFVPLVLSSVNGQVKSGSLLAVMGARYVVILGALPTFLQPRCHSRPVSSFILLVWRVMRSGVMLEARFRRSNLKELCLDIRGRGRGEGEWVSTWLLLVYTYISRERNKSPGGYDRFIEHLTPPPPPQTPCPRGYDTLAPGQS